MPPRPDTDEAPDAMNAATPTGHATSYHRREAKKPVPPGPLTPDQIRDLQRTIVRGLAGIGYTDEHITQIFRPLSFGTVRRRVQGARPKARPSRHQPQPPPN